MVSYAEKQEKPFWFSSLDQIVHFDAIIFCRTFVELLNYFGQFVWIEKKRVTIIVAFHFMKRRLKTICKPCNLETIPKDPITWLIGTLYGTRNLQGHWRISKSLQGTTSEHMKKLARKHVNQRH